MTGQGLVQVELEVIRDCPNFDRRISGACCEISNNSSKKIGIVAYDLLGIRAQSNTSNVFGMCCKLFDGLVSR